MGMDGGGGKLPYSYAAHQDGGKLVKSFSRVEPRKFGLGLVAGFLLVTCAYFSAAITTPSSSNGSSLAVVHSDPAILPAPAQQIPPATQDVKALADQHVPAIPEVKQADSETTPAREWKPLCDLTSNRRIDWCELDGDVRVLGANASVTLVAPPGADDRTFRAESWRIKPYPRKADPNAMHVVRVVTVQSVSGGGAPACTDRYDVPALVFSDRGYTGNYFHAFTDVILPLFLTARQYAGVQGHLQLRAGGPGQGPARAVLPPRPGRAHQPRRLQHRPAPRAQRLLHGRLHRVHARHLRSPARRRGRRRDEAAEAAADRARADAAVCEHGGDRARRREARVRGGGVGRHARGGAIRGARQQLRRHHGRARRRADQHGVRADGRGGDPGGAAGRAGVRGGLLPGTFQGHGAALPRVPDHAGGEHADRPVPARPPHLHGPQRDQEQGMGVSQGRIPRQAGRAAGHEEVPADAQEGHRAPQEGQGQGDQRRRQLRVGVAVRACVHSSSSYSTLLFFFLPSFFGLCRCM